MSALVSVRVNGVTTYSREWRLLPNARKAAAIAAKQAILHAPAGSRVSASVTTARKSEIVTHNVSR